ncbi:MAG TPA: RNA-directed DNA polymerase [Terriglobia bacterium]|nr:RNA-directed DNA polymerase [Terriglobia bacterium]
MPLHTDLIGRGYFPVEIPPAFSTASFVGALDRLPNPGSFTRPHSGCALHSIPRLQHHRRLLGIPNPLHQLRLAFVLEKHWSEIEAHMKQSTLSMTRLKYLPDSERGLSRERDFDALDQERIVRSSASRFLLKADLSRFYHSLYTHSIPWALHSKSAAKADRSEKLYGNVIDTAVRNTQDQQTLGIPVGPVTSDLISELLGVALDVELTRLRPGLKGLRYVDDYYLFFGTRSDAEEALADLHSVASQFAVEINPLKTKITELPQSLQPAWKADLRSIVVAREHERDDLMSFFSRAYENASKYPGNNVLKYAVKQSAGFSISPDCWGLYESFLLGSLVAEPSLAPTLSAVLVDYSTKGYPVNTDKLTEVLAEIASYHGRFKQGFEVAWALWITKLFGVRLPDSVWPSISSVDDSIVALLSLDLYQAGLADGVDTTLWEQHMTSEHLYTENWLLAYEAPRKGWSPLVGPDNYVTDDDFFGPLWRHGVEFYDTSTTRAATQTDWLAEYA